MKHQSLHKQQGLTLISWVIILSFVLFQGIMAVKIVPAYVTDSSVKGLVKNLETDTSLRGKPAKEIRKVIKKRLKINNIYGFNDDDIVIKKVKGGFKVTVDYEARDTLFGNLEYAARFSHEAIIPSR